MWRLLRFRVSTSGLLVGLFENSQAMGWDGDDDGQRGVWAIEGKRGGGVDLEADVPGPMKINLNRAYNNVRYFISQLRQTFAMRRF